jgi:hypothetical protein
MSREDSISRVACRLRDKGEGPYPAGGIGYLRLARLSLWLLAPHVDSPEVLGRVVFRAFEVRFFAKKWDHFLGGVPPAAASEGDLVFGGKPSHPLTLFNDEIYICVTNWGVGYAKTRKNLEILSMDRSYVAVGCSKRW